jgi:tRNA dimethylallyltransferase
MGDIFYLVGPTAVGKSSLALDLAERMGAEIVNADAFQIYRGIDILTGAPDLDARRRVPHHLLSAVQLSETMSAAKFRDLALAVLGEIRARGKPAIIVSGSGLYVKALTHGFDRMAPPNPELRAELAALPANTLAVRLRRLDPDLAARTDLNNPRRIVRAIEIAEAATTNESEIIPPKLERSRGENLTATLRDRATSFRLARDHELRNAGGIFLVRNRDDLYARINDRVCAMFREGVEREVAALSQDIGPTAAQALGLREIQQLLAGKISGALCIAKIQQATRRYAKRQLTWFRHQTNLPQLNITPLSHQEAVSAVRQTFAQK